MEIFLFFPNVKLWLVGFYHFLHSTSLFSRLSFVRILQTFGYIHVHVIELNLCLCNWVLIHKQLTGSESAITGVKHQT